MIHWRCVHDVALVTPHSARVSLATARSVTWRWWRDGSMRCGVWQDRKHRSQGIFAVLCRRHQPDRETSMWSSSQNEIRYHQCRARARDPQPHLDRQADGSAGGRPRIGPRALDDIARLAFDVHVDLLSYHCRHQTRLYQSCSSVSTLLSRIFRQCRPSPSPSSPFKPAASAVALVSSQRLRHSLSVNPSPAEPVVLRQLYPLNRPDLIPKISVMADTDMSLETYEFPSSRLRRRITSPDRTPLVLIACGSFSPITFLHLRMFEMAADYARFNTNFEVVGAYLSCVGDAYKKTGLVKADHRVNMCNLAVQQSSWISVDPWEALHTEYLETAKVLDHFHQEINEVMGGVETPVGKKQARIALLAGADLIQTMSTPGLWSQEDIDYILKNFGAFIVERTGTDVDEALSTLQQWRDNIWVIQQLVQNDISSTKIRLFRRRDMSIRYLVPEPVVQYIEEQNLYDEDGAASVGGGKGKGREERQPGGS
nr:nicotinamide/nicotinic acid mononucleotide adenylyltransferase 2 [Quercus suber]